MELKKVKVIMLPTNNQYQGVLCDSSNGTLLTNVLIGTPQHLYFITNEDIKEGDWYILYGMGNNPLICKWTDEPIEQGDTNIRKKIIATTDTKLINKKASGEQWPEWDYDLPQPSELFIEKYCKLDGINEVNIEYTNASVISYKGVNGIKKIPSKLKINSHNIITIHSIKDNWTRKEVESKVIDSMRYMSTYIIKTNTLKGQDAKKLAINWIKENL